MEPISSNNFWDFVAGAFYLGYVAFVPFILILRLFSVRSIRHESINFLSIVNLTISIAVMLRFVLFMSELFLEYGTQNRYEYFSSTILYELFDVILFILTSLIGILFLINLLRAGNISLF